MKVWRIARPGRWMLREHLAITAQSAVNPLERSVVINPMHPDFGEVVPGEVRTFRVRSPAHRHRVVLDAGT